MVGGVAYGIYSAHTGNFNGWHLAAAIGGGAAAGALIGTGVGWAAGVGVAETTAAAVTVAGAAETANVACGGDMCSGEVQGATNALEEAAPALENAVTQVGDDVASSTQQTIDKVQQIADDVGNWLGDDLVSIRNEAGDFILRNAENTRKFRFDFYNPSPHSTPHFHLEWLNEAGEWVTKRIFLGE